MRNFKKFGALAAVFALSAIGVVNASAAEFTASKTGALTGFATNTQVFTTNAGQVKCGIAEPSGSIVSTASTEQHMTVAYKNCTAFGFANVHVTPATYLYTAGGTIYGSVHIKNTITINVTVGKCHVSIVPQVDVRNMFFSTNGPWLTVGNLLSGITYHATGGLCGSGGSNGTLEGGMHVERVLGGSIGFDH